MATTNYPGSLDSYPVPNNGDTISVADHWLGPAVIGIETELGTDPAGTFTDVKSRLDDVDKNVITDIDMWQVTASSTGISGTNKITSNWARSTTTSLKHAVYKGGGLNTPVSGNFSFSSTGIWKINARVWQNAILGAYGYLQLFTSNDGTNYTLYNYDISEPIDGRTHSFDVIMNVTNTANDKFYLVVTSTSSTYDILGGTAQFYTGITAMKIGEV